jgi:anti-sigma factor RsiW
MMPTAIHAFSQEEVMAYFDGELAPERALAVAQHLEQCYECQQLAADFQEVSRRLMEVEPDVSGRPQIPAETSAPSKLVFRKRPAIWIASAAAAILLITVIPARLHQPVGQKRIPKQQYSAQRTNGAMRG